MLRKWKAKDPDDVADYVFDWGSDTLATKDRFLAAGVNITTSVVSIDDPEDQPVPASGYGVLSIVEQDHTDKTSRVRFAGGTPTGGTVTYPVTCDIDVTTGEHFQLTNMLTVKERIKQ